MWLQCVCQCAGGVGLCPAGLPVALCSLRSLYMRVVQHVLLTCACVVTLVLVNFQCTAVCCGLCCFTSTVADHTQLRTGTAQGTEGVCWREVRDSLLCVGAGGRLG
jgi:hypothetical protein